MAAKIDGPDAAPASNAIDPARLTKEIARIEDALAAKLSHRMAYVESCKPFNEAVANAYELASAAAGVPVKLLKTKVKQRDLERKIEAIEENIEDDDKDMFEQMSRALGELKEALGPLDGTPLGRAAEAVVEKASPIGASNWTAEMEQRLRSFVAAGFSATKIGEAMSLTAKQVSSKANRMGLSLKGNAKPDAAVERQVGERDVGAENGERLAAGITQLPH